MRIDRKVALAAALDVGAIVLFAVIGRRNHDETGNAVTGALTVAAPFLIALAVGWLVARAWTNPSSLRTGLIIWPVTIAVGMVLRHWVFDRGTAASFIVVATIATGVLLLGWRGVARAVRASRAA